MSAIESEKEQIEQVKELWKNYGIPLISGVIIAALLLFAWRSWQEHLNVVSEEASMVYENIVLTMPNDTKDNIVKYTDFLKKDYKKTPYPVAGALILAQQYVMKNKLDDALLQLNWAQKNTKDTSLRQTIRLRIARILIAKKSYTEAMNQLNTVEDPNYRGMIDELKGDIYLAQGQEAQAKQLYQQAWPNIMNTPASKLLQMKLANLGIEAATSPSH